MTEATYKAILIKKWVYEMKNAEARTYHTYIECNLGREWGTPVVENKDGYVEVYGTILKETEKAIRVKLGAVKLDKNMSGTTWTTWIPKSQIA